MKTLVTDELWVRIEPLLPPEPERRCHPFPIKFPIKKGAWP